MVSRYPGRQTMHFEPWRAIMPGILMWLIGIPIPIIILLYLIF